MKQRRNWAATSIDTFMAHFKTFIKYCDTYESHNMKKGFDREKMFKAIVDTKRRFANEKKKTILVGKKHKFALVPKYKQVRTRLTQVEETLTRDLGEKTLTVKQLKALNYFLLQTRLNVRSGVILGLTWEVFDSKLQFGYMHESNEHKTGALFMTGVNVKPDQVKFLKELKVRMTAEYNKEPHFIFSNKSNTSETSIATMVTDCFVSLYKDDPAETRYNANSIRKFWEMRTGKMSMTQKQAEAHFSQTGHSADTAQKHYKRKNYILNKKIFYFFIETFSSETLTFYEK